MPTKILAIDDSKTMRLAIKITFAAEDAEVTAVSKGSEAVVRAKQMVADVVLVDATLAAGEPSGYDVCSQLKGDAATAGIPVIILASGQTGVDAGKLKSCGADGSLTKPFETQELIDKVAEVLGKRPATAGTQPAVAPTPPPASVVTAAAASTSGTRPVVTTPTSVPPTRATVVPAATPTAAPPRPTTQPPVAATAAPDKAAPALRLQPQAAAAAPAAAPRPTTQPPVAATRPADGVDGGIPIAVPIPFTAASEPTPGMLARLKSAQGGATGGLDPRVAEAIVALSREVLEAVAWEVLPELAEQIVREQRARAG